MMSTTTETSAVLFARYGPRYRIYVILMAGVLQSLTMFTLFIVFPPEKRGMAMGLRTEHADKVHRPDARA